MRTEESIQTFAVKCWGPGGSGTSVIIVNATPRMVGLLVMNYLRDKPEGYRQCQQENLLEIEPHEDSSFADERVSLDKIGVVLEYHYPEEDPDGVRLTDLIYIADADALADELDGLQAQANQGRGVCCVRDVIAYLRRGDYSTARAVINNESDKIRSYEKIVAVLERTGLWHRIDFAKWSED